MQDIYEDAYPLSAVIIFSTRSIQLGKIHCNSSVEIPFKISVTALGKVISSGISCPISAPFTFPKDKSPREIYLVSKVDEGASSVGYARKSFASFLKCEPAHCQHEPSILFPWTPDRWKEALN
jgi:hypothetical protein